MECRSLTCDRCGTVFQAGDSAWRVLLSLTADTLQGMSGYADLNQSELDARLKALLDRIELIPAAILEDQVFQEFSFFICGRCRGILAANPLQKP